MDRRGSVYFLVGIIVVMAAMVLVSLRENRLEAKLLPVGVGGAVILVSAVELSSTLRKNKQKAKVAGEEAKDAGSTTANTRGYLIAGAWTVGFVLAIYVLGFTLAIPVVTAGYIKSYGATWLVAIATGIISGALIYGIFEYALKVGLYGGLIPGWLGG
ncbi:MAG: tripartite tricarboxylate transporter TctB family protein [Chloroflexi bacterium]|nr:tripartite tricarboxylate transporter TctB family protein [Chloroflexota bacterium]